MVARITSKADGICPSEMKDGDVGVIISWSSCEDENRGRIVQRVGNSLQTIGGCEGECWGARVLTPEDSPDCLVRVFQKGETISITF